MAEVGYIFPEDAAKQVVEVGNAIKSTDDKLLAYTRTAGNLITLLKEQNISFDQLKKVQKETVETTVKLDTVGKQLLQSEEKLKHVSDQRTEQIIKNRLESTKAAQAIKDKLKANQAEEGSLVRMKQKLKELTEAYDKSGTRTKAATKEINNLSREIGKAEAATNRHQRGVGGYADQLGNLPGVLGNVVGGLVSTGRAMWALVANPIGATIAAITLVVTGLFKAFKSTDEGATLLNSVFKSLGNIIDVLIDRIASFGKLLFDVITLDFKGMKENGEAAFGGIADALRDAAVAGYEYEQQMDRISDRESASLIRAAKLRKEIEELTVASKNRNLGSIEQARLAQLAIDKSIELNAIEKSYAKERTEATLKDLASKIANDKLTTESKQHQLDEWLSIDDKQLESAIEKDKAFAEFYNNNEEDFKNLQKLRAADIDGETQLVTETRRLKTSLFTFQKEINNEAIAEAKKRADFDKAILDDEEKRAQEELTIWAEEINRRYELNIKKIELEKSVQDTIAQIREDARKTEEEKANDESDKILGRINKINEDEKQQKKETNKQIFDGGVTLANTLFDLKSSQLKREFEMAEGNEQKQKEISARIAKTEKNKALFDIAISTAVAITKALPNLMLAGIAGAIGLVQAGIVASKPIPKFAKGTDFAPSEFVAGEAGRELIKTKSGDVVMADKTTHFKGNRFKGATVYTNRETEQIIKESGKSNSFVFDTSDLRDEMRAVKNAINKKPIAITDNSGRIVGSQSNNYRETYLNRMRNGR